MSKVPADFFKISSLAKKEGLKNVVVSCGWINPEPLKKLLKYVDAYKVDLKSFNEKYYEDVVGAKLEPVLETIKIVIFFKQKTAYEMDG